jgi:hypothetical protein
MSLNPHLAASKIAVTQLWPVWYTAYNNAARRRQCPPQVLFLLPHIASVLLRK